MWSNGGQAKLAIAGSNLTGVDTQDGAQAVRTLPATVPSQDPMSGAATTGDLATVTVRDQP